MKDLMSGFFVADRRFLDGVMHNLTGIGFKILLDIIASSIRPVKLDEIAYVFRPRARGESKLDLNTTVEYLTLLLDKMARGFVPVRFLLFLLVGSVGIVVHETMLAIAYLGVGIRFPQSQAFATGVAMTVNYFMNNRMTYRDFRLRGSRLITGLFWFMLCCSLGAAANFALAKECFEAGLPWLLSGLFGSIVAAVWNYSVSSTFVWRSRHQEFQLQTVREHPRANEEAAS